MAFSHLLSIPRRAHYTVRSVKDAQSQLYVCPFPNAGAQRGHSALILGSVRNGLGARAATQGKFQEDWAGPDSNF